MKCPIDDTLLQLSDRNGIEIDYCPMCRGVWLDRGELDKLIEKSTQYNNIPNNRGYDERRNHEDKHHYDNNYHGDYKHKKKESFLGDLFDF